MSSEIFLQVVSVLKAIPDVEFGKGYYSDWLPKKVIFHTPATFPQFLKTAVNALTLPD